MGLRFRKKTALRVAFKFISTKSTSVKLYMPCHSRIKIDSEKSEESRTGEDWRGGTTPTKGKAH